MQIYFEFTRIIQQVFFPEGASPLYAGVTPRSISKRQGGLPWGMHWRKPDCKIRYWYFDKLSI